MNFIFISPNFPENYWNFCDALRKNGVTVLGIGDAPYDSLDQRLREALAEYYRVGDMEDYDQVYRAVAHFASRYGRIDWIESNNEYWLEQDARLRTDFNVNTGIKTDKIERIKEKSEMKKYYAAGGIRTARQIKAGESREAILHFAYEAGYPIFAKPDIGVGAGGAHKIADEAALLDFLKNTPNVHEYVIEEFVTGDICTYDAIINAQGEPIFESMCVCPPSIADIVNYRLDSTYYVRQHIDENLRFWGRQTVKAFDVRSRFVHLEFFRLSRAHRGLGNKGDFVALEVNMRPGGGYTPDMINYAHSVNVYQIWGDMIAFNCRRQPDTNDDYFCVYAGRRSRVEYHMSDAGIMDKYAYAIQMAPDIDKALAPAMGDHAYIARFRTEEERDEFLYDVCNRK
ncbi:MAG: hypothetical protein K2J00_06190 [Bacteroidaceae bacterium]|nr:hypothetical protein [Bacteroidaceae bacterium]